MGSQPGRCQEGSPWRNNLDPKGDVGAGTVTRVEPPIIRRLTAPNSAVAGRVMSAWADTEPTTREQTAEGKFSLSANSGGVERLEKAARQRARSHHGGNLFSGLPASLLGCSRSRENRHH